MREMVRLSLVMSFFSLMCECVMAANHSDIMDALDISSSSGLELIDQRWIKYSYDEYGTIETNPDGSPVRKSDQSTSKWVVQVGTYNRKNQFYPGTSPVKGNSCVRTNLGTSVTEANDAQCTQLIFKAPSGGTLGFYYQSGANSSDSLQVLIDGQLAESYNDQHGLAALWKDNPEDFHKNVVIPGGVAPAGSRYAGQYVHEVIFQFVKSEPWFYEDDNGHMKYEPSDEPMKPNKQDYVWDGYFDRESYEYDMADLFYSFQNCIWLDGFTFTMPDIWMTVGDDGNADEIVYLLDTDRVYVDTNAMEQGYVVRYTLDGSTPTNASPECQQLEDGELFIPVKEDCVVSAMAFTRSGTAISKSLASRKVQLMVSKPEVKLVSVDSSGAKLVISSSNAQNTIYYTTNGSVPTASSTKYNGEFIVDKPCTVKAVCQSTSHLSDVASLEVRQAAKPEGIKTLSNGQEDPSHVYMGKGMTVSCAPVPGYALYYSVDGSEWKPYSSPMLVSVQAGQTKAVVSFRNHAERELYSEVATVSVYKVSSRWELNGENAENGNVCLQDGWNLFGMPLSATSEQLTNLPIFYPEYRFFAYDNQEGHVYVSDSLEEGRVYWVYQRAGTPLPAITLIGAVKDEISLDKLGKGWHGYGASKDVPEIPSGIIAWQWKDGKFQVTKTIKKGGGYFIYKAE